MPLYDYKCKKCGKEFVENHSASKEKEKCSELGDSDESLCVEGDGELERVFSSPSIYKGKEKEELDLDEEELEKLKEKRQEEIDERMNATDQEIEERVKRHYADVKHEVEKDKQRVRDNFDINEILKGKKNGE